MAEFHEISGYEVVATLGQGARSTIYEVRSRTGEVFALKRVVKNDPTDQRFIDQALNEHAVATKIDSPLVRKSYKVIRNRAFIRTSEVLVLMERVVGKTLEQSQPEDIFDLCGICRSAAQGLKQMHERGFVHADIKPNNIVVTGPRQMKLIDFGQSCPIGTVKERIQGTPDYIAPEQVLRRSITPATDVFNLGATMYWLLTKRHVPTLIPKGSSMVGQKKETAAVNLRHDKLPTPTELNPAVPMALTNLVMECVQTNPNERPRSMQDMADRFEVIGAQILRSRGQDSKSQRRRNAS